MVFIGKWKSKLDGREKNINKTSKISRENKKKMGRKQKKQKQIKK